MSPPHTPLAPPSSNGVLEPAPTASRSAMKRFRLPEALEPAPSPDNCVTPEHDRRAPIEDTAQHSPDENHCHADNGHPAAATSSTQAADAEEVKTRNVSLDRQRSFIDQLEATLRRQEEYLQHLAAESGAHESLSAADAPPQATPPAAVAPPRPPLPARIGSLDLANALLQGVAQRWQQPPAISEKQMDAVALLLCGEKQETIAEKLGIHRGTLWRWRTQDPEFRRALAIARDKAFRQATEQLHELVSLAIKAVQHDLLEGNSRVALQVLRLVRMDKREPTPPYTDAKLGTRPVQS